MGQTVKMTVHYIDGTHQTFSWTLPPERSWNEVSEMKKNLQEAHLIIKLETGGLIIIPRDNIKYIETDSAPEKMPPNTILDARLLDE